MRSSTSPTLQHRCHQCYLQTGFCLCAEVPRVETQTQLVIVRHALEGWKTTNTARIGLIALPHAELLEHGGPEHRLDESRLRGADTWLLFPGGTRETPSPAKPLKRLIVVDGTWA